ncbi:hypothetical protein GCK72_002350 [Caenorhabditis remanei]|uniref:RRM domain-containing protein n=1 Tax=Caenorhabditis remanei TaxID=31234 RepID=A0A6A5HTS5_CAERE|nr:hypothetical protein GCK72_002350 [Caenorhabditis remanei]KAF1770531.1 hypothetical protein GCK72_002350 [Caenorhabditis remanei]
METLLNYLQKYGEVIYIVFNANKANLSEERYAYVKYLTRESAQQLIDDIENMTSVNGGVPAQAMMSRIDASTRYVDTANIYATNLPDDMTEAEAIPMFSSFGKLREVQQLGTGFFMIQFSNESEAIKAVLELNGQEMSGKTVEVSHYGRGRNPRTPNPGKITFRLYNLRPEVDNQELHKMFNFLGDITARVERNVYGTTRCMGYVMFERPQSDTPFFNSFADEMNSDGYMLYQKAGFCYTECRFKARPYFDGHYSKFYPSAMPPLLNRYYQLPYNYRLLFGDPLYHKNASENKDATKFLRAYNVHVSNIGNLTDMQLAQYFANYGEIIFVIVLKDVNPYGIVSFTNLPQAHTAVEDITRRRADGLTVFYAEIMDCYQLPHFDEHELFMTRIRKSRAVDPNCSIENTFTYQGTIDRYYPEQLPVEGEISIEEVSKRMQARVAELTEELNRGFASFEEDTQKDSGATAVVETPIASCSMSSASSTSARRGSSSTTQESETFQTSQVAEVPPARNPPHYNVPSAFKCTQPPSVVEERRNRPQEKHRPHIIKLLEKYFYKKTDEERLDMLNAAYNIPMTDLPRLLKDVNAFRRFFVERGIELAQQAAEVQERQDVKQAEQTKKLANSQQKPKKRKR